ncbi:MAG: DUF6171 family protein [Eubacteriales bacterium]|nr:DUF6171 family protein [Eubacteriales bacterium]MDD3881180.1 DUF6171 family protein [Eubacteriales bacterium]MDD4511562.1 DUF6171 family protein [Eubacteriales bacterium]
MKSDAQNGGGGFIPCRVCLLRDMRESGLFQTVSDYISSIPAEEKTPDDEYEKRLLLCRSCDNLKNAMCALCGCFVEARAAKTRMRCADTPEKW